MVLDCTSGAGTAPVLLGIDALKRREGVMVTQGELAAFPDFPLKKMTEKCITLRSARGHGYRAVELALDQLASGRFPLERLATHRFPLEDVDQAIRTAGGRDRRGRHPHLPAALGRARMSGARAAPSCAARPAPTAPPSTGWPRLGVSTVHEAQGRTRLLDPRAAPGLAGRPHRPAPP